MNMSDEIKCPECGYVDNIAKMELFSVYDSEGEETEIDCSGCDSRLIITSIVTGWKFEVEVQD
jgi:DNA-directed RNA polymerase subunit RPC12/RpoP